MIRVVRIAGEAFDIETGTKTSKAIVLSNGTDEVHVPVRDDIINAVLHLAYLSEPARENSAPAPEVVVEHKEERTPGAYDDPRSGTASI